MNKKLLFIPMIAVLVIGLPTVFGQGVPQALDEVEIAFEGINQFLIDLDSRVTTLSGNVTTNSVDITDVVIDLESTDEELFYLTQSVEILAQPNFMRVPDGLSVLSGQLISGSATCPSTHPYLAYIQELGTGNNGFGEFLTLQKFTVIDNARLIQNGTFGADVVTARVLNATPYTLNLSIVIVCSDQP